MWLLDPRVKLIYKIERFIRTKQKRCCGNAGLFGGTPPPFFPPKTTGKFGDLLLKFFLLRGIRKSFGLKGVSRILI